MEASIVDLRYKTAEILQALDRNEEVAVLYRGKVKGVIKPVRKKAALSVTGHPFFGMYKDREPVADKRVAEVMGKLRKPLHDL